jgi:hypothetical protein
MPALSLALARHRTRRTSVLGAAVIRRRRISAPPEPLCQVLASATISPASSSSAYVP